MREIFDKLYSFLGIVLFRLEKLSKDSVERSLLSEGSHQTVYKRGKGGPTQFEKF